MSKLVGVVSVLFVLFLAMGFAVANGGHRVTVSLGLMVFHQVPVTLVAFSGLFVGMLVMFASGVHADLKVRRILRERLAEEARREQTWSDRNQRDLFAEGAEAETDPIDGLPDHVASAGSREPEPPGAAEVPNNEEVSDG